MTDRTSRIRQFFVALMGVYLSGDKVPEHPKNMFAYLTLVVLVQTYQTGVFKR